MPRRRQPTRGWGWGLDVQDLASLPAYDVSMGALGLPETTGTEAKGLGEGTAAAGGADKATEAREREDPRGSLRAPPPTRSAAYATASCS